MVSFTTLLENGRRREREERQESITHLFSNMRKVVFFSFLYFSLNGRKCGKHFITFLRGSGRRWSLVSFSFFFFHMGVSPGSLIHRSKISILSLHLVCLAAFFPSLKTFSRVLHQNPLFFGGGIVKSEFLLK